MSGEINGTKVIISKAGNEIVGQMESTLTVNGALIDIANKSLGDFQAFMSGELAGKGLTIAGTIIYNDDTVYKAVVADALVGTEDDYEFTFVGSGATTDESYSGKFIPNGLSIPAPKGEKVSTSITFQSNGAYVHTPAV